MLSKEKQEEYFFGVYNKIITPFFLPDFLYLDTGKKLMSGVFQGYGGNFDDFIFGSDDFFILEQLHNNIHRFSAAKTFQQTFDTSLLRLDRAGNIKTFSEFKKDAQQIYEIYNETWLETEFTTAIAQANSAAHWKEIEEEKNTLPLLTYVTARDEAVRESHRELDGITRPVGDEFWNWAMPPNGFNCFDSDTEIYTNYGWIFFKNLTGLENVLTLNPVKRNILFQKPINWIKKEYQGKMMIIKSNSIDIKCTLNHSILIYNKKPVFKDAENIKPGNIVYLGNNSFYKIKKEDISIENYFGYIYCVEVPKYNTIYIRRNGKFCWIGNCRCIVTQHTKETTKITPKKNDIFQVNRKDQKTISRDRLRKEVPIQFRFNSGKEELIFIEGGAKMHPYFKVQEKFHGYRERNFGLKIPSVK